MLIIKMLKKASNKNNIELAEYLNKTRNTIASWENDENNIPNTEKRKLSTRFEFDYNYWYVGLDKTTSFYQKMYSEIKNGYLKDSRKQYVECESRIDEILRFCDGNNTNSESYEKADTQTSISNEEKHFNYINSLLNDIDPINNSKINSAHFIYDYKYLLNDFDEIKDKFSHNYDDDENSTEDDEEEVLMYYARLREWRTEQALIENVKSFQILSDEVLYSIAKAYVNKSDEKIKNFPRNGIKWNRYYKQIIEFLNER